MRNFSTALRGQHVVIEGAIAFFLSIMSPVSHAESVIFDLSDLHFVGPGGQNGWPDAVDIVEPGVVGHLQWTFTAGDFQNGTGSLLDLTLPITSLPLSLATTTSSLSGITGSYTSNAQNLSYDFAIVFSHPLSGPNDSASVDSGASTFDFTGAYAGGSPFSEWTGNIVAGVINASGPSTSPVPEPNTLALYGAGLAVSLFCRRRSRGSQH